MKNIGFVMITDEKYLHYSLFTASSIQTRNPNVKKVLILVNCINKKGHLESMAQSLKITFIYAEEEPDLIRFSHEMKMLKVLEQRHVPTTTFFKLTLIQFFKNQFDRIVYLDTDLLLIRDLEELCQLELMGCPIGAVRDSRSRELANDRKVKKYFNAGILVFDLNHEHIECLGNTLLTQLQKSKNLKYQDQDVLNVVFDEKWFEIPKKFNFQIAFRYPEKKQDLDSIVIVHFIGPLKPWKIRLGYYHEKWESEYIKFQTAHPNLMPVINPSQASLRIKFLIYFSTFPLFNIIPLSIRVVLASLISKKFN